MGGGLVGLGFSLINPNGIDILNQINGVLGALVAVTGTCLINIENVRKTTDFSSVYVALGGCFLYRGWEAMVVGMIGGFITCVAMPALDRIHIDDPVGAAATHGTFTLIPLACRIFINFYH